MTEGEICTFSNWMFLLYSERGSSCCELLLFATVNQEEMNCSSSVLFFSVGRIHILFTIWGTKNHLFLFSKCFPIAVVLTLRVCLL